ncbi:MAG: hypothetical protein AAFX96_10565, partial [Pseudomonadota bacterium]
SLSTWSKDNGLNLDALTDKQRHAAIEKLGSDLLTEIARIIPVLPVAVTARVFLNAGDTLLSELELKSLIFKEMSELENSGAHLHIPREDRDYAASMGLRMLTLRHLVETTSEGLYKANPNEQVLLEYYANSIAHLRGKAD